MKVQEVLCGKRCGNNSVIFAYYLKSSEKVGNWDGGNDGGNGAIDGVCGPTQDTCNSGNLDNIDDSIINYLWNCVGSGGGTTDYCSLAISGDQRGCLYMA